MSDKQILAWLKSKRNGAYTQYWNARQIVTELEAMMRYCDPPVQKLEKIK